MFCEFFINVENAAKNVGIYPDLSIDFSDLNI